MVVLCAAEVGASMAIGSLLLLADFYRRLSPRHGVHDMESERLLEDYAGSSVSVLEVSKRASNLAKAFVGIYLLSASLHGHCIVVAHVRTQSSRDGRF